MKAASRKHAQAARMDAGVEGYHVRLQGAGKIAQQLHGVSPLMAPSTGIHGCVAD